MADRNHSPAVAALWSSRLLLTVMVGAGLVIAAFLTVLSGSWWLLAVAVIVLFTVTLFVVRNVLSLLGDVDAPSPTERARLEAQGVLDPDRRLNHQEADSNEGRVRRLFREDSGDASSTEEQQSAWTPAPSRRV
jgi:membrane protein implicated in regulation of membrane protease activity